MHYCNDFITVKIGATISLLYGGQERVTRAVVLPVGAALSTTCRTRGVHLKR